MTKQPVPGAAIEFGSCRVPVARAYYGMLDCGASTYGALNVAARVYCYHHPAETIIAARSRVEHWLKVRIQQ